MNMLPAYVNSRDRLRVSSPVIGYQQPTKSFVKARLHGDSSLAPVTSGSASDNLRCLIFSKVYLCGSGVAYIRIARSKLNFQSLVIHTFPAAMGLPAVPWPQLPNWPSCRPFGHSFPTGLPAVAAAPGAQPASPLSPWPQLPNQPPHHPHGPGCPTSLPTIPMAPAAQPASPPSPWPRLPNQPPHHPHGPGSPTSLPTIPMARLPNQPHCRPWPQLPKPA
ncbi:uncharacterized protein LOC135197728 [Macrobrachium nipponense]|uniref:uncharacterized protein LOC135197728 n=1 Tax=Macrobrachium nipponense TaxID=159736 RepID=UPI0030C833C0